MTYERELQVALEAADLAGGVILDHYARFEAIADAPASITTQADRDAQDTVLRHLLTAFPGDAARAEERTAALDGVPPTGPRLWVVDPIDGTRGFARKNGEFSGMVAFVDRGAAVVGVALEPAAGLPPPAPGRPPGAPAPVWPRQGGRGAGPRRRTRSPAARP